MADEDAPQEAPDDEPSADGERMELPSWNRSRSKRKANVKAEAEDDAFQRGVRQAGRSAITQPRLIMAAIVIVGAAIAAFVYFAEESASGDADATRALAAALAAESRGAVVPVGELASADESPPNPLFESAEARKEAVESGLVAARESGSADMVLLLELVEGARALRTGDHAGATSHYNAFLAAAPEDHRLAFVASEGKGLALEGAGDLEGALAAYEALAPEAGAFYRDQALWNRGRVLEALERPDEAIAIYKQYFEEFPPEKNGLAREQVRNRLRELDPEAHAALDSEKPVEVLDGPPGGP